MIGANAGADYDELPPLKEEDTTQTQPSAQRTALNKPHPQGAFSTNEKGASKRPLKH